jgi:hypothetical protein
MSLANSPFLAFCAVGGQAFINSQGCVVSVEVSTWSQVKKLFD